MRTGRLLLGCLAASLTIHLAAGAHYDFGGPVIERSASPGGDHAVVGEMEDLFAGVNVPEPVEPLEEAEVEPVEETPVEEAVQEADPVEAEEVSEPQRTATLSPILQDTAQPAMPAPEIEPTPPDEPLDEILPDEEVAAIEPEEVEPVEPESAVADVVMAPVPTVKPEVERPKREVKKRVVRKTKPVQRGNSDRDQSRGQTVGSNTVETGDGGRKQTSNYLGRVNARLQRGKRYPRSAGGAEGTVLVGFTIARSGAVSGLRVVRSSGNGDLDGAALENVSRVAPFPEFRTK